jgi:protoheme IX farnesyltransferase
VIKDYYYITKPGIIRGNILTLIAGFLVGSRLITFKLDLLLYTIVGTSFVVASACVFNNVLDRKLDKKMTRTKNRALVTGSITVLQANIYATILGLCGLTLLIYKVNSLTALLGLAGMYFYAIIYSYFKRKNQYSTLVGSISGAVPPLAGYTAAINVIDNVGLTLFLSMACWQMSHFYSIAIYRLDEYKKAGIPLLPIIRGVKRTQISVFLYIFLFLIGCSILYLQHIFSDISIIALIILSTLWLGVGLYNFQSKDFKRWGKTMFLVSLIIISAWCLLLSVDSLI